MKQLKVMEKDWVSEREWRKKKAWKSGGKRLWIGREEGQAMAAVVLLGALEGVRLER